jgi:hypothetical protein
MEKISTSIADTVNRTIDLATQVATSMTIFTSILGGIVGLGKTYDNIVSPVQDLIERIVVNNLPKDFVPAQIKDTFDKAKEVHGISSPLDELGTWQDIKSKRDEEEYKQFLKREERLKKQRENDYV